MGQQLDDAYIIELRVSPDVGSHAKLSWVIIRGNASVHPMNSDLDFQSTENVIDLYAPLAFWDQGHQGH